MVFLVHWYTSIPISPTTTVNIIITITYANTANNTSKIERTNEKKEKKVP
ncbi:MAG: hypothetical protein NC453_28130 [Muribaculum sp.]|nr:hypothetical protein [Muribaculum sp.]